MNQIWTLGLMHDYAAFPFDGEARVAILVESPEHGRELHRLLPQWSLATAINQNNETSRPTSLSPSAPPTRTIITLSAVESLKAFNPHILIVASGGDALPEFGQFTRAVPYAPNLVIDIADTYDESANDRTQKRFLRYHELTWYIVGLNESPIGCEARSQKRGNQDV